MQASDLASTDADSSTDSISECSVPKGRAPSPTSTAESNEVEETEIETQTQTHETERRIKEVVKEVCVQEVQEVQKVEIEIAEEEEDDFELGFIDLEIDSEEPRYVYAYTHKTQL
jgi:hypothetical protein